jgi:agmatinase
MSPLPHNPYLTEPRTQLSHLLRPCGILTFTTGSGEVGDYLLARFGSTETAAIERAFAAELERIAEARVILLGVPNDNGAGFDRGSKKGPLAIRQRLLARGFYDLEEMQDLVDIGDVRDHPLLTDDRLLADWVIDAVRSSRWGAEGARLNLPVSAHSILERVLECIHLINPAAKVLLLGGDHSISQIPVEVLSRHHNAGTLGIVQLDAHTDLLEERDGLPISYATWAWHANQVIGAGHKLVQVGVRTSGTERSTWEKQLDIHQIWAEELRSQPTDTAVEEVIKRLEDSGVTALYLSHDIDAICPSFAAATGTPEPDGLHPDFVKSLITALGQRFELCGADLMEVAPTLSRAIPEEPLRTLELAADFVELQARALLGGL